MPDHEDVHDTGPPRGDPAHALIEHFKLVADGDALTMETLYLTMANELADRLPAGPEKTVAMRKLLESKDCAVRAVVPT